jgi:hypothetical protein
VSDDELTDAWEAGQVLPGGISHVEHHGSEEARARLLAGTERACRAHGVPEKFDAELTGRWADVIAGAAERDGLGASAGAFLAAHPELSRGDRF